MYYLQGDLNLNICEAHAFNTQDRFSLDVFVVNEWRGEVISYPLNACSGIANAAEAAATA